jgi:hypothetical protein
MSEKVPTDRASAASLERRWTAAPAPDPTDDSRQL